MQILSTVRELRSWSRAQRSAGFSLGLVPTMGALHQGHASLLRSAAASCQRVAATLFVNPTQFGPNEDFDRYPRTFEADCQLARECGTHLLFAPSVAELYPNGPDSTIVDLPELGSRLDGASRPGHFRGVATVVTRLLIAAEPDRAFFGQKDAAQVAILRRMVQDLLLPVELIVCPTVREADGLALSSRNTYLSPAERQRALALHRALLTAQRLFAQGERRAVALLAAARGELERVDAASSQVAFRVDYVELVDRDTLLPIETAARDSLLAVAAWVGVTRLIDNTFLGDNS